MTTNNGNEGRLLDEAQRIVDRAYQRIKVERQYRRLCNALEKLGITQLVGTSWCSIDEDSLQIGFGALPEHRRSLFIIGISTHMPIPVSIVILARNPTFIKTPCFRGSGDQRILCVEKHNAIDQKLRTPPPGFGGLDNKGGSC